MNTKKFALAALVAACAGGAQAAPHQSLAYIGDASFTVAWTVDWNTAAHTAHLVNYVGAGDGSYTDDGRLRVLTLAAPIETTQTAFDCNGLPFSQVVDLRQLAVRHVAGHAHKGSAQVVEIGTTTDLGGCTPGLVAPYGSTADAGTAVGYLDMDERPPVDDLRHGATLAGMSDTDPTGLADSVQLVARTVTFTHGSVRFDTGASVPRDVVDGWFVLDFGTFQRGYTRLAVDPRTHAETWLGAAWRDGAPQSIFQTMMVQPTAHAGFGGHAAQSREWNSGLFLKSTAPTQFELFPDGTGLFVEEDQTGAVVLDMPATWVASGADLVITRSLDPATTTYVRTWVPLANYGRAHFIYEREDRHNVVAGTVTPRILQRVNFYLDQGPATAPAPTPAAATLARRALARQPAEPATGARP
ncbi:MAG TPA: hypothetical protein VIP05_20600 [Burkholderiaceae bacterium]